MTATVFAMVLGAALLHAMWNALVKVDGDRLVIMALMLVSQAVVALGVLPFVKFPPLTAWPYIWASLLLHNAYYLFLITAYRYGDLSQVYPIARGSSPVIIAIVSVVYVGETLNGQESLSVAIIALSVMSLALTRRASGSGELKAVLFALGTGIFIAAYTVVDGLGARLAGSAHSYTFWLFALDGIPLAALALYLRKGQVVRQTRISWKAASLGGAASLLAYWIVIWAMTLAPITLVSAVRETSMIFAVLIGGLFLRERIDFRRLAATVTTLIGAVVLKTSK